jgi:hypothetical protein
MQYDDQLGYYNLMMKVLEDKMPELKKDRTALPDWIGAWKPR